MSRLADSLRSYKKQNIILACGAACAVVGACVTMPSNADERADAVGVVTVSSPFFTPLVHVDDDKNLRFGALRDEAKLAEEIKVPSLRSQSVLYEGLRLALAGKVSGPQIDLTQTMSSSAPAIVTNSTISQTTPEVPASAPAGIDAPASVQTALAKLLERSNKESAIPPDQAATLIAAYKTYMVNLEEYYNAEGFEAAAAESDFRPYKVHFTVTAEPGWYTRYRQMEAVVELAFGDSDDVKVLTVTPPETAQAIDSFTASWSHLQSALQLSGSAYNAAAMLDFDKVKDAAKSLEGLRMNKTLTVAYPECNKIRIRFRPSLVATESGQDLQPTSRVLTAIVLVRVGDDAQQAKPEMRMPRAANKRLLAEAAHENDHSERPLENLLADVESSASALSTNPKYKELAEKGDWSALAARKEPETAAFRQASEKYHEALRSVDRKAGLCDGAITVKQTSYFSAAVRDDAGQWRPPRDYVLLRYPTSDRFVAGSEKKLEVAVPAWSGSIRRDLKIANASGYFELDASTAVLATAQSQTAQDASTKAKADLDSDTKDLKAADDAATAAEVKLTEAQDAATDADAAVKDADHNLKDLQAKSADAKLILDATLALQRAQSAKRVADRALAAAQKASDKAAQKLNDAKAKKAASEKLAKEKETEFKDKNKAAAAAWSTTITRGCATARIDVKAPRQGLIAFPTWDPRPVSWAASYVPRRAVTWARLFGACGPDCRGTESESRPAGAACCHNTPFERIGSGDASAVIVQNHLQVSDALPSLTGEKVDVSAVRPIHAFVEVIVALDGVDLNAHEVLEPGFSIKSPAWRRTRGIVSRAAQDVLLTPHASPK